VVKGGIMFKLHKAGWLGQTVTWTVASSFTRVFTFAAVLAGIGIGSHVAGAWFIGPLIAIGIELLWEIFKGTTSVHFASMALGFSTWGAISGTGGGIASMAFVYNCLLTNHGGSLSYIPTVYYTMGMLTIGLVLSYTIMATLMLLSEVVTRAMSIHKIIQDEALRKGVPVHEAVEVKDGGTT
jgi:lipid-A-disaccharide synthase-like uncharacterized protein